LITQNIDNLHTQADNSLDRTYQIHGNIKYTRCSKKCTSRLFPLAKELIASRTDKRIFASKVLWILCVQYRLC